MSLKQHAPTAATLAAQLCSTVYAFPEESRAGARELVLAMCSLLAGNNRTLRADVDAALEALNARAPIKARVDCDSRANHVLPGRNTAPGCAG